MFTLERPRTGWGGGGAGGGVDDLDPPLRFSDQKLKLSSNQNEKFRTCSRIFDASFGVNWMTSSFIIYAKLIKQTKVVTF